MGFNDLSEFFDPDLYLPIRGKTYRIPAASADRALRLRQMFAARAFGQDAENREAMELLGATWVTRTEQVPTFVDGTQAVDDKGDPVTREVTIGEWSGGVYAEMVADGLTSDEILHAGLTAVSQAAFGTKQAESYWSTALLGDSASEGAESGNPLPPLSGDPTPPPPPAKKAQPKKRAPRKKTTGRSSTASTARTTPARARTAKTTRAAGTTTP